MPTVDHTTDIRKYTRNVDAKAVAGIVKHLGVALQHRDSSLVACADKRERERVRDHFLKKKLGLTHSDQELDTAVMAICERMARDKDKSRVTFYYLLTERYRKLAKFSE